MKLFNKRGDGLSMNVIVMAVIALLILVILSFIVLRGTGGVSKEIDRCDSNYCVQSKDQCAQIGDGYTYVAIAKNCIGGGQQAYCCTRLG
ncbi:MAG TPA: hypothetical protein VK158_01935 [Acidobacteriota bacterium]|nr:hypothetical protein [Acidobacteriota bacterium]